MDRRNFHYLVPQLISFLFTTALGLVVSGCGTSPSDPNYFPLIDPIHVPLSATECQTGVAQIMVGDGFLQNLCGCTSANEERKVFLASSGPLTCHVGTSNTVVFFHFINTTLRHQIIPQGTSLFSPSPVSDPNGTYPIRAYAIQFPQPATVYTFEDAMNGMTGQIYVP